MRRKVKVRCCACGKSIDLADSFSSGYCKTNNAGWLCGTCAVAYNLGLKEGSSDSMRVVDITEVKDRFDRIIDKLEVIHVQSRRRYP